MNKDIDKDAFDHSYEGYLAKMQELAQKSPNFELFVQKIKSFTGWYHGDPILPEFRSWTLPDYQKFYEENQE